MSDVDDGTALPAFRYHPDPLRTGAIERRAIRCQVCARERQFRYAFPLYAVEDVDDICPWCIADGSACRKYDGDLVDPHVLAGLGTAAARDELAHRTPSFGGAEQCWPYHCEDFCAFLQNARWRDLAPFEAEIKEDLEALARDMSLSVDEVAEALGDDGYLYGYLFRCLHCGKHRCHADAE